MLTMQSPPLICVICGAMFLIADDQARITEQQARQLGRKTGDPICHSCWINRILVHSDGSPHLVTGHCCCRETGELQ